MLITVAVALPVVLQVALSQSPSIGVAAAVIPTTAEAISIAAAMPSVA
ncbi:MAG TPA: hypothetical protein VN644_19240 [Pyrinomonadaceae bacterium]|nr:hypothetical protein [Pyrinomonadaceae bacterium]